MCHAGVVGDRRARVGCGGRGRGRGRGQGGKEDAMLTYGQWDQTRRYPNSYQRGRGLFAFVG